MYLNLSRVDLNLLVALNVLLEEKSTTRAADRLCITQSAMSRTLKRLRDVFNDELFIRTAHGLKPTPKALALEKTIERILADISEVITPEGFNPANASGEIHLGIPEPIGLLIIPHLIEIIRDKAPGLTIHTHNLTDDYYELLLTGRLDFVLYQYEDDHNLISRHVGTFRMVCLMRKDHPLAKKKVIDQETFLRHHHILYTLPLVHSADFNQFVEISRNAMSHSSCILETTQLSVALSVLNQENALMVCSAGTKDALIKDDNRTASRLIELPLARMPIKDLNPDQYLTQHKSTANLPLYQWIELQIEKVMAIHLPILPK